MQRMTQHIHLHHPQQPQYVHYSGPPGVSTASSSSSLIPPTSHGHTYTLGTISGPGAEIMGGGAGGTVNGMSSSSLNGAMVMHYQAPGMDHQTSYQQHPQQHPEQVQQQAEPVASGSGSGSTNAAPSGTSGGIVASGDWTKDLVQLAKQAELKCVASSSVFYALLIRFCVVQKTRFDTSTTHCAYPFSACNLGRKIESDSGCQRTKEQVRTGSFYLWSFRALGRAPARSSSGLGWRR